MLLALKDTIIYGPVNSRRLGRSLGINILPPGQKTCTFNCVYCQYGWTDYHCLAEKDNLSWPSTKEVEDALAGALARLHIPPAYITFSGNGEPTLHPCYPEIVVAVKKVRDRLAPDAQVAVLSNSTLTGDPDIQKALAQLDRRIMKLDCGHESTFARYNKPFTGIEEEAIVNGLAQLEDITIQALFSGGEAGNVADAAVDAWVERLNILRPSHVQIYTLDRDAPAKKLVPALESDLQKIECLVKKARIPVSIY